MLGVGWTEMLVIGVVALIVIGPKELPSVMHRVGKFAGTIRRMGQDFQRELNKTTGLNEIRNLRESVTQPLKATADAIRKEFNTTTPTGEVKPSGAIAPVDPKAESVVDEIKAKAGIAPVAASPVTAVKAPAPAAAPVEAKAPVKATRAPRIKAPAESKVETADIAPAKPVRKSRAAKPVDSPAPAEAIAPTKPKATRKPAAKPVAAAAAPAAEVKPAAPRKAGAATATAKAPAARKPRKPAADKSTD